MQLKTKMTWQGSIPAQLRPDIPDFPSFFPIQTMKVMAIAQVTTCFRTHPNALIALSDEAGP